MASAEPAAKKQKVEEVKAEDEPKLEPPKELEDDAKDSNAPRLKEAPQFLIPDTTLNVLKSGGGTNVLMSLTEGGIQHFLAGARANAGITKGRYAFEVKIVQYNNTADGTASSTNRGWRNAVRVGFSTAGSDLMLGESCEGVGFDSQGFSMHSGKKTKGQTFGQDDVMTVLLNRDSLSPNCNTVSLFKDGIRISEPIPLPAAVRGKPLHPHVCYKGAVVHVNFGPHSISPPLPFKCRLVQDANKADVTVTAIEEPQDGKYSVLCPVGLPGEGTFEWLDMFMEKNSGYVELSDRKIMEWASKSGLWKPPALADKTSKDRPHMNFQVRELDDRSMRKAIYTVAPMQPRHYIIMEVRGNLIKDERLETLAKFSSAQFRRISHIVVGEPNLEFKKRMQGLFLVDKQAESDKAHAEKLLEAKRQRELERRQKQLEREKAKAEKEKQRKLEAAKKEAAEKVAAAKAAKAKKEGKEVVEEKKEAKEQVTIEDSEEEKEEPEPADEPPPKVELTSEDRKQFFRVFEVNDLCAVTMSQSFANFSLPTKEEGFDELKYEWTKKADKSQAYLTQWILDRKVTTRVEDLVPSKWFREQWENWQSVFSDWKRMHKAWSNKVARRVAEKEKKERAKASQAVKEAAMAKAKEVAAAKAAKAGEKKKEEEEEKKEGEKEVEEKKEEAEEVKKEEEPEEEEVVVDFAGLDIFGVENVEDLGGGMPLFAEFGTDDWTMLATRFELHLLVHAFRKDVDDAQRPGIHVDHLEFYYNKYYRKWLAPKDYGVETFQEIVGMVNDSVYLTPKGVLGNMVAEEMETPQVFCKLTEEARRYRKLRIDMGQDATLKLAQPYWHRSGDRGWRGKDWNRDSNRSWRDNRDNRDSRDNRDNRGGAQSSGSKPQPWVQKDRREPYSKDQSSAKGGAQGDRKHDSRGSQGVDKNPKHSSGIYGSGAYGAGSGGGSGSGSTGGSYNKWREPRRY